LNDWNSSSVGWIRLNELNFLIGKVILPLKKVAL